MLPGNPLGLLVLRPEGAAHLHPAGRHAGEAAQAEPQALPPRTLLEVCRVGIQDEKARRFCAETDGAVLTALQQLCFWLHTQLQGHGRFVAVSTVTYNFLTARHLSQSVIAQTQTNKCELKVYGSKCEVK